MIGISISLLVVSLLGHLAEPAQQSLAAQVFAPPEVVEAALNLAGVSSKDFVVDLGSGDGRVVIAAAKRGARALGIDIDPDLISRAEKAAATQGLSHLAKFQARDFLSADIGGATVVLAYLSRAGVDKVRERVVPRLPGGARLISITYDLPGWKPDATRIVRDAQGVEYVLYMWQL